MTEVSFTNYIKSYVDNDITIPNYVSNVIAETELNPIKIYNIGLEYLRKGLDKYAKPILKNS